MIDAALRIRLEGRVEVLERALIDWAAALEAAKRLDFRPAAQVLEQDDESLTSRGDAELAKLLAKQAALRRSVRQVVGERLKALGLPAIDLARGAKSLEAPQPRAPPVPALSAPVLYEHHTVTLSFLVRALHVAAFTIAFPTLFMHQLGAGPLGALIGVSLFALVLRNFGWSDVVLTARHLVLEDDVIELTGATRVIIVRPFMQYLPSSFEVEVHYTSGKIHFARIRHASKELRAALRKLKLDTGSDWGPW